MPIPQFDPSQPFEQVAEAGGKRPPTFDPSLPFEKVEPSLGQKALNAASMVGKGIDAYGGDASTRAAISAAQHGKPVIQAFTDQYGKSEGAPTGKQIAMDAGVPDQPFPEGVQDVIRMIRDRTKLGTAYKALVPGDLQDRIANASEADVAGTGVEMAASPLNALPVGKPIVKGLSEGTDFIKNAIKSSWLGEKVGAGVDAIGRGAAKVGSALTGASPQDIRTYATQAPAIRDLTNEAKSGGSSVADVIRNRYQNSLKDTRQGANSMIDTAINASGGEKNIDLKSVLDQIDKVKDQLNPELDIEDLGQIDKLSQRLKKVADEGGKVSPSDISDITAYLQKQGKPAYGTGGIFQLGSDAQRAAKAGAGEARELRNKNIPGIEAPYGVLSDLRDLEKKNKNLVLPGTPEGALSAAGSGNNERSAEVLRQLSDITGTDMLGDAQKMSAARTFNNPSLTPLDTTGKSVYRLLSGAAAGAEAAGVLGLPAKMGAQGGMLLTSPAMMKGVIDSGRFVGGIPAMIGSGSNKITREQFIKAFLAAKAAREAQLANPKKK